MVANLYHSPGGPRAARRLAARIVLMSALYCAAAAALTLSLASRLPRVFTRDGAVLALVRSAEAPAGLMMALAWCNCLEGCLLGESGRGGGGKGVAGSRLGTASRAACWVRRGWGGGGGGGAWG